MAGKVYDLRRLSPLQLHLLLFVVGMVVFWYNVVATSTYPGNATVPFEVFRPMIIERANLAILWALLLLIHFAAQQFWNLAQRRARASLLDRDIHDERLRDTPKSKRSDSYLLDESEQASSLSDLL